MMSTATVAPLLGTIISNLLYLTPLPVVLEARYTRYLGPTNPLPFVLICFSSTGWTIYGCLKDDPFLFTSAFPGIVLGLYYVIVCLTVIAKRSADADFSSLYIQVEYSLLFIFLFWSIIGFVAASSFNDYNNPLIEAKNMIGMLCGVSNIVYYASPLSTLKTVIAEKDSSTLYLPLLIINLTNSSLWFIYGLSTKDPNIFVPNTCAILLTISQIIIRLVIPAHEKQQTQTWEHVWHLIRGQIPPTFVTDEKVLLSKKYARVHLSDQLLYAQMGKVGTVDEAEKETNPDDCPL